MRRDLGEILVDSFDLTLDRLKKAWDWKKAHGGTIDRALLVTGAIAEKSLNEALSLAYGVPPASREAVLAADPEVVAALPSEARHRLRAIPYRRDPSGISVAVTDPSNPILETGLVAATGRDVAVHVIADAILEDLLTHWDANAPDLPLPSPAEPPVPEPRQPSPSGEIVVEFAITPEPAPDPIGRLARALLAEAIDAGAVSVEFGKGDLTGFLRTLRDGKPPLERSLPAAVVESLVAWFLDRSRAPGPSDEGKIVVERASGETCRKRFSASIARTAAGGVLLEVQEELAPTEKARRPAATGPATAVKAPAGPCLHRNAGENVFCPDCGAPV